ncbi:MAG: NAD-dependent epimerase/dehydratase family protein [Solirubrobacteraceae bacterium]
MIAVTGANGYVGGRILAHLRADGFDAIALVRRPTAGDERARRYALAEPLDEGVLDDIDTVVHAAYDVSVVGEDIRRVNAAGSLPLLDGLAERGGRVLMISSLSAFEGARSLYGRAKLELERAVLARDGVVLRPGVVFGMQAAGMFGEMVKTLSTRSLAPMVGGGSQRLFVTHDESLAELIAALARGRVDAMGPLFSAHEVPTTLRAIAEQIAATGGRRLRVIPLPPALVQVGMRCAESIGVRLPFRSDSLLSLLHPIPLDQVSALARPPVEFPPLDPELWLD